MKKTGYFAFVGFERQLEMELGQFQKYGRLYIKEGAYESVRWAQNHWLDPEVLTIRSISDASKILKERAKLWSCYHFRSVRRCMLIEEQLAYFSPKPIHFLDPVPFKKLGAWTLFDDHTICLAKTTSSPYAHGEMQFKESPIPPSRAYLKLWEIFTRMGSVPKRGTRCMDLGASPGSWTWVLQSLGAEVVAVDRSPLSPLVAHLPNVTVLQQDAFSIHADELHGIEWIFCDVICYPKRLLDWVSGLLDKNIRATFVCTIKLQGDPDYETVAAFERISKNKCFHLFHNKNELTWVYSHLNS